MDHSYIHVKSATTKKPSPSTYCDLRIIRDGDRIHITGTETNRSTSSDGQFIEKTTNEQTVITGDAYHRMAYGYDSIAYSKRARSDYLTTCLTAWEYGLLLDGYLFGASQSLLAEMVMNDPNAQVIGTEMTNGSPCIVVSATTDLGIVKLWIANSDCRSLLRWENVRSDWKGILDVTATRTVNGICVPVEGRLTMDYKDSGHTYQTDYHREVIEIGSHATANDAFIFSAKAGTAVGDLDNHESGVVLSWDGTKVVAVTGPAPDNIVKNSNSGGTRRILWIVIAHVCIGLLGLAAWMTRRKLQNKRK